ncbi:hypothetical protein NMY3_03635 [Candidatus Nitrosocosmicus oleophilus]|uniref:Uncharacterized protein n=1 Tax=Candidatus Nitrosocosmicus oleophilus TaxID=1353260 RepID=A0A654M3I7_9ARCH|nr:hypothetical protein NMY3_03635 [Candidatus Nitrosocosmicus oleophilus]
MFSLKYIVINPFLEQLVHNVIYIGKLGSIQKQDKKLRNHNVLSIYVCRMAGWDNIY